MKKIMIEEIKIESRLKMALADRKKTMKELSEETNISYSHLSTWVNGEVEMSLANIALICQSLKITDMNEILKIIPISEKKNVINLKVG